MKTGLSVDNPPRIYLQPKALAGITGRLWSATRDWFDPQSKTHTAAEYVRADLVEKMK